ncbi:hypothetical protein B1C78_16095 [Thioalkalivibrio denitrificans]|uniref:Rubrerythrin diiron-binding domain-containing protein n=1 Tax=Thioalkalivibrio denitrificans TaxID=108003 RepID=A0A1V3N8W8_9GAMM|nr:ferritin family protein [Thioalkalivibrio denitrificans]OOG21484.1 hypothetical protein B1C78_16095 [Thioalkalivibrio denitrificans]
MASQQSGAAQRALELAIAVEHHNGNRFLEWADRFRSYDPAISAFLEELADEERDHEEKLLTAYRELFAEEPPRIVPTELERYTLGLLAIRDHFLVVDSAMARTLLETALEIERYTRQFYSELWANTTDTALAEVYRRLSEFEAEHERVFENRIGQLAE